MEKDPYRPFSWEEENKKAEEAQEDIKKSTERLELLFRILENWQHKEIRDLIFKYAAEEKRDPREFYLFFITELKIFIEHRKSGVSIYSDNEEEWEKAMKTLLRYGEFEKKYSELCHFDLSTLSKIPATTEKTQTDVKEALPSEK